MTLRDDYSVEYIEFPEHSAPKVVATVDIEGQTINIVQYATLDLASRDAQPVFGYSSIFRAIRPDAEIHTLSRGFYVNDGKYHKAGDPGGSGTSTAYALRGGELSRATTVKGAIKGAADRIETDRLWATYGPVAVANCRTADKDEFDALDPNAEINPGDLVIVYSHQRWRVGVAIKTTRTKVSCLADSPTGGTNGATRTKGKEVRLLTKRAADPAPAVEAVDQDTAAPVLGMTGAQVAEMLAPRTDEPVGQGGEDPVLRDAHAEDCEVYLGHFSRATWDRCTCRVGVARMRAKLLAAGRIGAPLLGDDEVRALYAAVIAGGPNAPLVTLTRTLYVGTAGEPMPADDRHDGAEDTYAADIKLCALGWVRAGEWTDGGTRPASWVARIVRKCSHCDDPAVFAHQPREEMPKGRRPNAACRRHRGPARQFGVPVAEPVDQGDAVAAPALWPAGKTFGDLDPATRAAVVAQAAATLTGELAATGDALSAVLDGSDEDNQCRGCGAHISEPHGPGSDGQPCPNNPDPVEPVAALDEDEEMRCVAGRVAASMLGQADAVPGCTSYRMVHARTGRRIIRLHDAGGELLAVLAEQTDGEWIAVRNPTASDRGVGWPARTFGDLVAAVRSDAVPAGGVRAGEAAST
jgi:hypothetical protein